MKSMRIVVFIWITLFITALAYSYIRGPKNKRTGAPGEQICVASKCHVDYDVNSGPGKLSLLGLPREYRPEKDYPLTVRLQQKGQKIWGFELTAINDSLSEAGQVVKFDRHKLQLDEDEVNGNPRFYLKHTRRGTHLGTKNGPVEWHFIWQAPAKPEGTISFYVAGNAGNGNKEPTGDYIYQIKVESQPPQGSASMDSTAGKSSEMTKQDTTTMDSVKRD